MKKMYRFLFAVAAAATALVGCVREPEMLPTAEESIVCFTAESIETRTAFDDPTGTNYPTLWTENDQNVKIMLNMKSSKDAAVTPASDGKTATFVASLEVPDTNSFTFFAVSPSSAWLSQSQKSKEGEIINSLGITVPTSQTPSLKSVDEAAQILVAQSSTTTEMPEKVSLQFKHWTAYGKLTLSNLALNGAKIEAVDLTSEVAWANRWYYSFVDKSSSVNSASNTITVNTSSASDIWFACAPVDLSGKKLTVTVKTDKGTLTKEVTMPANREFKSGQVARFTVNMSGIPLEAPKVYERIKSTSELTNNSKVIIAAVADKYDFAISTTQNPNNRAQAAAIKEDDKILDPGDNVEVFSIETGTTEGTYAFKAESSTASGYLYAVAEKNYLRTASSKSETSDWSVSLVDNYAVISNAKTARYIRYNASNSIFAAYAQTSTVRDSVAIYKLVGSGGGDEPPVEKKDPGLVLKTTQLSVNVGESKEIDYEVASGYDGTVTFVSSDATIATVEDAMALGVKNGKTTITVTALETDNYKSATASCEITVVDPADAKTIAELLAMMEGHLNVSDTATIVNSVNMGTATVVAMSGSNVVAKDATGVILIYKSKHGVEVGDVIKASGSLKNYYGIAELVASTITKESSGATVDHGTPVTFDDAAITAFLAAPVVQYCKISGTLPSNASDYMAVGSKSVALYDKTMYANDYGKAADVFGYSIGRGSKGQVNFINTSIEVNANAPFLTVDATSKTWAADATDAFTVNVSVEEGGSWSYTPTGMDWATFTKSGNTLVVTPKAANTSSTPNEGSVVFKNDADATKTATVEFKQSGVVSGSSFVLDQAAITAAHTESWNYTSGEKTITAADGSQWVCYNTYANKGQVTVQMNKGKGSYVLTPTVPTGKKITHLVATCNSKSDGTGTASITRTFDIADGSTVVLSDIKGDDLTTGVDISGSHSQLKIYPNETNGGACYILNITITFE